MRGGDTDSEADASFVTSEGVTADSEADAAADDAAAGGDASADADAQSLETDDEEAVALSTSSIDRDYTVGTTRTGTVSGTIAFSNPNAYNRWHFKLSSTGRLKIKVNFTCTSIGPELTVYNSDGKACAYKILGSSGLANLECDLNSGSYYIEFCNGGAGGTCNYTLSTTFSEGVTMYRLYNPYTGEHLYTSSTVERDARKADGWNYEGEAWRAPVKSKTPVYRLYNPYAPGGDHHYTTKWDEVEMLKAAGWRYEDVAWYSDDAKGVPMYRQYNPYATTGTHNYTSSTVERDNLVGIGWRDEKEAWYGLK